MNNTENRTELRNEEGSGARLDTMIEQFIHEALLWVDLIWIGFLVGFGVLMAQKLFLFLFY